MLLKITNPEPVSRHLTSRRPRKVVSIVCLPGIKKLPSLGMLTNSVRPGAPAPQNTTARFSRNARPTTATQGASAQ